VKVLILKPSSLGDVVQALPVLRLLKRHLPHSSVYWWIDTDLSELLRGDPDLTGIVHFQRRRWAAPRNWIRLARDVAWARHQRFDWVIDLQGLLRSAAFAWLANGSLCVGLDTPREGARGFYDIAVPRRSFHTHAVDWYLETLKTLSVPISAQFDWLPVRPEVASKLDRAWSLKAKRWILVQPGARWMNKRWPVEHFAQSVQALAESHPNHSFAVLGSADEQPLAAQVCAAAPSRCLDLSGKLTLPELVEWIRSAELMLTNDTGPMHIAAAVGTPVVALFGPTEPRRTGPYGQLERALQISLPCVPCMRSRCRYEKPLECLRGLTPEPVLASARAVLSAGLKVDRR
jgi:lipopolysaccharide heptosyltransferase I